jgi:hypothetical protein
MATLREIIYDIREVLKQYSDDSNISNEYLQYLVHYTRALLLSQRFSSRSTILPQKNKQQFYLEMEDLPVDDNPFCVTGNKILRTKLAIPRPLEAFNIKSNIKINSGSYNDTYFNLVLPERFPYCGSSKWTRNQIFCTIGTDFKLYFKSQNPKHFLIEDVKLSMVCENPEDAYPQTVEYSSAIDFIDTEYPLEIDMITQIVEIIIKRLGIMLQTKEDKSNNSDDS